MLEKSKYCLRWKDYEKKVAVSFTELREEREFFDVTLGCSDSNGQPLQAHKVILSACSTFFKEILQHQFAQSQYLNPFIYLRGISHNDLSSVLDFMYYGEVNISQCDLKTFLSSAEELKIKGLTYNKVFPCGDNKGKQITHLEDKLRVGITKNDQKSKKFEGFGIFKGFKKRSDLSVVEKAEESIDRELNNVIIKSDPDFDNPDFPYVDTSKNSVQSDNYDFDIDINNDNREENLGKTIHKYPNSSLNNNLALKESWHMAQSDPERNEEVIDNGGITCSKVKSKFCHLCNYSTNTNQHLKMHIKGVHEKVKDNFCDQCEYATTEKTTLKRHKRHVHNNNNVSSETPVKPNFGALV